jgi:hypothetical protein
MLPGRAHRVGKQLAADLDVKSARQTVGADALDGRVADGAFDEDRRDALLADVFHGAVDVGQPGLGFRADALEAAHFDVIRPAEIVVGVVTGD